jgi:hypothetical protein
MTANFSDTFSPANGQVGSLAFTEVISKIAAAPQKSRGGGTSGFWSFQIFSQVTFLGAP